MKVVQVVPSINEEASGPSQTVPLLCHFLRDLGIEISLHTLAPCRQQGHTTYPIQTYPSASFLQQLGFSKQMHQSLSNSAQQVDIIHNHSLWMMPNVYPGWATKKGSCQLVTSPRGTLSKWALQRSYWKKKLFWHIFQSQTLKQTACFHATSNQEYKDIRKLGLRQPVAIIPNAIHIPELPEDRTVLSKTKRLLFLARIHPTKGLSYLIHSWKEVQEQFPDWQLDIVGPDNDGHLEEIKALAKELQVQRVTFVGPLYGKDKEQAYQKADLYVLPTHTENFGVTVAEALSNEVPAITTYGAPWKGLVEKGCGWWIPIGEASLTACLKEALSKSSKQLQDMGKRGRKWVQKEYSPQRTAEMMQQTYQWLMGNAPKPTWVRIN